MISSIPAGLQVDEAAEPAGRKKVRRRHSGIRAKWSIVKGWSRQLWRSGNVIPVALLAIVLLFVGWLIGSCLY
ncbi:MAG: hypothetical protein M1370_01315 [Bacteroidetes bacterium]|nr:hypothetical protein [Bacteroidota bacterium]MCL5027366.1 hypothetical protein [Chloroflexota bacterium]